MKTEAQNNEGALNRDLMRMARESLRNQWWLAVGLTLLYQVVISGVAGFIPFFGPFVYLLIGGPMVLGFYIVFLSFARRNKADVGQLFQGFNRFGTALGAYLLMVLFIILWSLLLIIPGIIAAYAYSMTFFIIADDPSVKAIDAITRSKQMMQGKKWKFFCLCCRFFGWSLLSILTLGIGYLWLWPYMQTSFAHFYDDVRKQASCMNASTSKSGRKDSETTRPDDRSLIAGNPNRPFNNENLSGIDLSNSADEQFFELAAEEFDSGKI